MDETNNDKSSIFKSTKSSKSSKSKSNREVKEQTLQINSDDISLSQLELMANKKKLMKKNAETAETSPKSEKQSIKKTSSLSSSSSSQSVRKGDYTNNYTNNYNGKRSAQRENDNDHIRKEKCEYLYKLDKLSTKNKGRILPMTMNNTLDEIRNEYERISNEMKTERSVSFFKRMLLLGVQGIEMLNTRFDPMGVDLEGWSEAMGYSLENQEYDEVLAELYEKYKGVGQMSPEVKLVFMIISSATMFTISKKITKMDSSNAFKNIIGSFVGQQQQQQQQYYQQQQQQFPQQHYSRDYASETSDDPMPSKLKGQFNDDDIDLNNILKTMNERKKKEEMDRLMESNTSDDVFKSIPMAQKKKRGRPPKAVTKN